MPTFYLRQLGWGPQVWSSVAIFFKLLKWLEYIAMVENHGLREVREILSVEVIDGFGNDFRSPYTLFSVGGLQDRESSSSSPCPSRLQLRMKRNVVMLELRHLKPEHRSLTSYI